MMRPRLDAVVLSLPMPILDIIIICCSAQEPSTSDEVSVSGIWIEQEPTIMWELTSLSWLVGWLARLQHLQC